jgi:hypothetical protein
VGDEPQQSMGIYSSGWRVLTRYLRAAKRYGHVKEIRSIAAGKAKIPSRVV